MRASSRPDPKSEALRQQATLNPHPEEVTDALFQAHSFFDARDLVQVRYELVRRVKVEGASVQTTAAAFGFSRVTVYALCQQFEAEGLAGLLPQPKGPHQGHKLSDAIVDFLQQTLEAEPTLHAPALQQRVLKRFGLVVHPRSIERALARRRKKA